MISEVCCDCVRARREKDNADDDEGAMEGAPDGWEREGVETREKKKNMHAVTTCP